MRTLTDLYLAVRERFPAIAENADRHHLRQFGYLPSQDDPYSWFESLADAVDAEMRRETPYRTLEPLFLLMEGTASAGAEEVRRCIDVAFVENLFWSVPTAKASPYWTKLPPLLKKLYVDFHRREP